MRSLPRLLLPLGLAALLTAAGCSKDKDVEPPATLVDFPQTLQVKKLWGEGGGGGKKQLVRRLGLGPAVDNGVVFAASYKGEVLAAALDTGRHIWLKNLKIPVSAGPGVGAGMVVVGSSKGGVVALGGATGRGIWRARRGARGGGGAGGESVRRRGRGARPRAPDPSPPRLNKGGRRPAVPGPT